MEPKLSIEPTVVNELLQTSTKLKQFVVTESLPEQPNVFKAIDTADPTKQFIVKITSFPFGANQALPELQTYVKLSRECNICKLLDYELVGLRHVITVMENCGMDLFSFMINILFHNSQTIDLNIILSIALQLLDQISCLQRHDAVHGDIKIENVLIDDTGTVTLVDFDKLPVIGKNRDDTFTVSDLTSTEYGNQAKQGKHFIYHTVKYYNENKNEREKLAHIFFNEWLSLDSTKIWGHLYNVPPVIYDKRRASSIFVLPNQAHVNIIDWYSWSYVILMLLWVFTSKSKKDDVKFNEFVYSALLAIIMNIIVRNDDPKLVPVDVFDIPINADYIRKVGLGITVLLHSSPTVLNESYTNYKVRVFLDLIQRCESADELVARFQRALSDPEFEEKQRVFDAERAESLVEEEDPIPRRWGPPRRGGARRRRTHNKKHRPKKCKRTKRGTRRMRYKKK